MYCSIQKKMLSKESMPEISPIKSTSYEVDDKTIYDRAWSDLILRPHKEAWRIVLKHSFRENGKVKQQQIYVGTLSWYELASCDNPSNYISEEQVDKIVNDSGARWDTLAALIDNKLAVIVPQIKEEYHETEEYKVDKQNNEIIRKYVDAMMKFKSDYPYLDDWRTWFMQIYDIFLECKRPDILLKAQIVNESTRNAAGRGTNYTSSGCSYSNNSQCSNQTASSTYNDGERKVLKQLYRLGAQKFHPDMGGSTEDMQILNNLKDKWKI